LFDAFTVDRKKWLATNKETWAIERKRREAAGERVPGAAGPAAPAARRGALGCRCEYALARGPRKGEPCGEPADCNRQPVRCAKHSPEQIAKTNQRQKERRVQQLTALKEKNEAPGPYKKTPEFLKEGGFMRTLIQGPAPPVPEHLFHQKTVFKNDQKNAMYDNTGYGSDELDGWSDEGTESDSEGSLQDFVVDDEEEEEEEEGEEEEDEEDEDEDDMVTGQQQPAAAGSESSSGGDFRMVPGSPL
jgi:hypothetical protein